MGEARIVDALKQAFAADPAVCWVWPEPQKYLEHFSSFAKAFGGRAFAHESAYYVEDYAGAALWLPPNVHCDVDTLIALLQSSGSDGAQQGGPAVLRKWVSVLLFEYISHFGLDQQGMKVVGSQPLQ